MSHQSDWSYYKQLIKLLLVKVNHVCEDFILSLEQPSLFFYKQKTGILVLALESDISNASFAIVEPRTLWMGFKRVQNLIISRRTIVFGIN